MNSAELNNILTSNKRVFVAFSSFFCYPCRITKPFVQKIEEEFPDIKVVKIDVGKEKELAIESGVLAIPTFRYYEDGKLISQKIGAISKESMVSMCTKAS